MIKESLLEYKLCKFSDIAHPDFHLCKTGRNPGFISKYVFKYIYLHKNIYSLNYTIIL